MNQIDNENDKLKKKTKEKSKKGKKKEKDLKHNDELDEENDALKNIIVKGFEMPEGVNNSDDESKRFKANKDINDPHRALDINLDEYVRNKNLDWKLLMLYF